MKILILGDFINSKNLINKLMNTSISSNNIKRILNYEEIIGLQKIDCMVLCVHNYWLNNDYEKIYTYVITHGIKILYIPEDFYGNK